MAVHVDDHCIREAIEIGKDELKEGTSSSDHINGGKASETMRGGGNSDILVGDVLLGENIIVNG